MDTVSFLPLLLDTLQREEALCMDMKLTDLAEWDSIAAMAILALADRKFNKKLALADFKALETVDDLYVLLTR